MANFLENDYNEKYYKETVALGILFRTVESLVSEQEWYQQGFRAQIVTYSIALFSKLFSVQYPKYVIDFQKIWKLQAIPKQIIDEFIHITKLVNDSINDPFRSVANVTQWCKRADCWKRMQAKCKYIISASILDYCISHEEELAERASARSGSKKDTGIMVESMVVNYGAANWQRLHAFVLDRKITLLSDTLKALNIAEQLPRKIPNSYQAKLLNALLETALNEGFKKYSE